VPLGALDDRAQDRENKIRAEFAGDQRGDGSGAESTKGGEFQHDHLKIPSFREEDAAPRLFPIDFVRLINGFVYPEFGLCRPLDQADGCSRKQAVQVG
jgi:hypothetical protein